MVAEVGTAAPRLVLSATDAEWPTIRAEHERWLASENFDADGEQRSSLRVSLD